MPAGELIFNAVGIVALIVIGDWVGQRIPSLDMPVRKDKTAGAIGGEGGAGADRLVMHRNSPSHEECGGCE